MSTTGICETCGGPIYRPEVVRGHPSDTWLHARDSDWEANPHNAEPQAMPAWWHDERA